MKLSSKVVLRENANLRARISRSVSSAFWIAIGSSGVLGLSGALVMLDSAIAPQSAQAYLARVDLLVDRLPNETFDAIVRRAELVARAAAQRAFDKDVLTSDVSIIVVARTSGGEAPLLSMKVTREEWRSQPDAHRWATLHRMTYELLGFRAPIPVAPMRPASEAPSLPAPSIGPSGSSENAMPLEPSAEVPAKPIEKPIEKPVAKPLAPTAKPIEARSQLTPRVPLKPLKTATPLPPASVPKVDPNGDPMPPKI